MPESSSRPLAERIAWYSIAAVTLVVPIVLSKFPFTLASAYTFTIFQVPKLASLGFLIAVALTAWSVAIARGQMSLRRVPGMWWALAFFGLASLSAATASNPQGAVFGISSELVGLFCLLLIGTLFFLVTQLVTSAQRMKLLARCTVLGGGVVALIGLLEANGVYPLRLPIAPSQTWMLERGASTIGNSDLTGTYLVLPLILAAALSFAEESAPWRVTAWASLGLTAGAILVTMTRGAWLGGAIGLAALSVPLFRSSTVSRRTLYGGLGGLTAVVSLLALTRASSFVARFTELGSGWQTAGGGRLVIWTDALAVIVRQPLLGVGADSFRLGWFPVRSVAHVSLVGSAGTVDDPHNIILMFAATLGIPATIAAVGLVVHALVLSGKSVLRRDSTPALLLSAGWWAALVGISVSLLFSTSTIVIMIALGITTAVTLARFTTQATAGAVARYSLAVVALIGALVAVTVSGMYLMSDYSLARAQTGDRQVWTDRALRQAPWNYEARTQTTYEAVARAAAALQSQSPDAGRLLSEADRATLDLIATSPREYNGYLLRAQLLTEAGLFWDKSMFDQTIAVADEGIAVQPNSVTLRTQKAFVLRELKRYDEMAQVLRPVWSIDSTDPWPGTLYAEALILGGRPRDAEPVLAELSLRFPENAEVKRVRGLLP